MFARTVHPWHGPCAAIQSDCLHTLNRNMKFFRILKFQPYHTFFINKQKKEGLSKFLKKYFVQKRCTGWAIKNGTQMKANNFFCHLFFASTIHTHCVSSCDVSVYKNIFPSNEGQKSYWRITKWPIYQICYIFSNLCCTLVTSEQYLSALDVKMNYTSTTRCRIFSASKRTQDKWWGHLRRKVMLILVRQPPINYR